MEAPKLEQHAPAVQLKLHVKQVLTSQPQALQDCAVHIQYPWDTCGDLKWVKNKENETGHSVSVAARGPAAAISDRAI